MRKLLLALGVVAIFGQLRDMLGTKHFIASTATATSKDRPHTSVALSRSSVQQFKTETDAKSHCGTDQVVWGNMGSHVLHDAGTKYYGKTAHGAYMCKGIAVNAGYHEAKE